MSEEYGMSHRARLQADQLGMAVEEAFSSLRQSVPFTHPEFNRRYEGFVFQVRRKTIEQVGLYVEHGPPPVSDPQVLALLGRSHTMLENLMTKPGWNDLRQGDIERLIDDLEPYKQGDPL